ncbi:hypothetical protein NM87255_1458 [Neisseria meningitidis 87255]|nr:hypothetical protein B6116_01799 [Neisseria meningitidis]ELK58508.1 hypothetical protein NM87255_1458 [Neisseria meningitidis 87255]CWQ21120.1 Uncharacterised protein [Neisseria meningitidis]CWU08520.1 Uncharacterised protein [Neisseria meningitidis]CWU57017.1 Uncharacterised protein [Neisseria meningitidis]
MMGMLKVLSDTSIRPTLAEPSFPRKWESRISGFQSFPIDSRLRGNDGSIHTETCTTSFPRKWESRISGFQSFPIDSRLRGNDGSIHTETCTTSFPRKWESRISGFQSFPIDSRRVGGLDSRLRGNDEFRDYGVVGTKLNRHSHESGNLERGVWATVFIR